MSSAHGPETPHSPVRYEKRDVDAGAVVRFGVILAVVTLLTSVLIFPVFSWLRGRELRRDPPPPPMGRQGPGRLAPEPRLQEQPAGDFQTVRRQAEEELNSYGWVDEEKGIVRIPIDEAMRRLAERSASGSPSPSPPPAASPGPVPGRNP